MARTVLCAKLGQELPGLEKPPFPGPLGLRIFNEVSQAAWEQWREHQTILINHYALNPVDPDARKMLRQEMEKFFFSEQVQKPEGWVPVAAGQAEPAGLDATDAAPSKGGGGGGAARKK
ncbi:MAG TPA: oxidative damage protection protein [Nitrolancea sp.]|nr:oxidative damage protection protein [Nitrolancea sp.]